MRGGIRGERVLQILRDLQKQESPAPKEVSVKGDSVFVWQALDPDPSIGWFIIAGGILDETSPMALVTSKLDVALMLEPIAVAHANASGQLVRLSEFKRKGGTIKSVTPR